MEPLPDRIERDGLVLRCWEPSDAEVLHEAVIANLEHLRPWMGWTRFEPLRVEERRTLIEGWRTQHAQGSDAVYGIFSDDAVVGGCGLHSRIGPGGIEVGYWVAADQLRRGVATRASAALTDAAFATGRVDRVEIHHSVANEASRGVPERLGFRYVGTAEIVRDRGVAEVGPDGIWRITIEEWRSGAPR